MKLKTKHKALTIASGLLGATLLTGCGGTDGTISDYNDRNDDGYNDDGYNNTSSNIDNITGKTIGSLVSAVFIDAEVEGLDYKSNTYNGKTDFNGQFNCAAGEQVEFLVGTISLGTSVCQKVVTPQTLAAVKTQQTVANTSTSVSGVTNSGGSKVVTTVAPVNANDPKVIDRIRLLLSLDSDGNPANGIKLSQEAQSISKAVGNLRFGGATFDNDVQQILTDAGVNGSLPAKVDAENHFRDSLNKIKVRYPSYDEQTGAHDEYDESLYQSYDNDRYDNDRYDDDRYDDDRYDDDRYDRW